MDMYIEAKALSEDNSMDVRDKDGEPIYEVHSKPASLGSKIHVSDPQGNDLLYIHENVPLLGTKFWVEQDGEKIAEVKRKMGVHNDFEVDGLDWSAEGNVTSHEFTIREVGGEIIGTVTPERRAWGDTYHLWIHDDLDPVTAIGVIIAINKTDEVQKEEEVLTYGIEAGTVLGQDE